MRSFPRNSTPRVKDGKVQRKNRSAQTLSYENTPQEGPCIDRQRPGPGYRHVLLKRDVERFIEILPDWAELSKGLNAIILAPGHPTRQGWHRRGIVAVCAWERELVQEWDPAFAAEHDEVLDRLEVRHEPDGEECVICHFDERSVRGFQLMHILLHELGHHHDRMSTRSQRKSSRGESFAEQYALSYAKRIWERYFEEFGW